MNPKNGWQALGKLQHPYLALSLLSYQLGIFLLRPLQPQLQLKIINVHRIDKLNKIKFLSREALFFVESQ